MEDLPDSEKPRQHDQPIELDLRQRSVNRSPFPPLSVDAPVYSR